MVWLEEISMGFLARELLSVSCSFLIQSVDRSFDPIRSLDSSMFGRLVPTYVLWERCPIRSSD